MRLFLFISLLFATCKLPAQNAGGQTYLFWQQQLNETVLAAKPSCFTFSKTHLLFIGAGSSVYCYNGLSASVLPLPAMKPSPVTAVCADKNNTVWVGFQNGSIVTTAQQTAELFNPEEGLPKSSISKLLFDADNRLWFATQGEGIYVQHKGKLYNINTDDGLADNYIYDLQLLPNNAIAAATDKGLSICSFNGSKKTIENYNSSNHGLTDNIIRSITADPADKNTIWLGYQQGGIGTFSLLNKKARAFPVPQIGEAQVNDVLVLDEQVWITTDMNFLQVDRNGIFIYQQPLTSPTQLAVDEEANGWLLSYNGVFKSNGEKLNQLVHFSADEANNTHDVWQDEAGNVWYNNKNIIVKHSRKENRKQLIPLPGLDSKTDITSLYYDGAGYLWIGTLGKGIYRINISNNKVQRLNELAGNESMSILSISGRGATVWISSLQGIFRTQTNSSTFTFENLTSLSGIGINYIYHIYEDSKGRVWFATDGKGLVMMEQNRFTHFGEQQGLAAKVIYAVAEDRTGTIWCSTLQKGLFSYNGKNFTRFGKEKELPDTDISSLDIDNRGNLFCISRTSYFLIDAATHTVILPGTDRFTGVFSTDLNCTHHSAKGTLFFTSTGVFQYRRPSYQIYNQPQTSIQSISLFLNKLNETTDRKFAYDENNLSFSFNGLYYTDPARVQYQYKLEGYNNEWQRSKNTEINFPKLQPGTYRFRVRSSVTGNFDHATEASYSFVISKPFWLQWWFITLSILLAAAILWYVIKEREKSAKRWQQLQTEKLQSQYETLKNQVNPHFLFNSFNTLLGIIEENPKRAAEYVEHLSDFYRSIVNMREKDLISLGDEIAVIDDYFFIQQKRFGCALIVDNRLTAEEKSKYSIPPLTLQLLVENAIKHNVVSKEYPLTVELFIEDGQLVVRNNRKEKTTKEKSEGMGLQNIRNRFSLIADKDITIESTELFFTVKLPLIKHA